MLVNQEMENQSGVKYLAEGLGMEIGGGIPPNQVQDGDASASFEEKGKKGYPARGGQTPCLPAIIAMTGKRKGRRKEGGDPSLLLLPSERQQTQTLSLR